MFLDFICGFCMDRDIKAGEVVVSEQAVAFVPRTQDRTAVCHQCCQDLGQSTPSVECSNCKHVVFCKVFPITLIFLGLV